MSILIVIDLIQGWFLYKEDTISFSFLLLDSLFSWRDYFTIINFFFSSCWGPQLCELMTLSYESPNRPTYSFGWHKKVEPERIQPEFPLYRTRLLWTWHCTFHGLWGVFSPTYWQETNLRYSWVLLTRADYLWGWGSFCFWLRSQGCTSWLLDKEK